MIIPSMKSTFSSAFLDNNMKYDQLGIMGNRATPEITIVIPYLARNYLPFKISCEALYLSRLCTALKENNIKFDILNLNDDYAANCIKVIPLISKLTNIISRTRQMAINYLTGKEKGVYFTKILEKIVSNLQSLNISRNILYIQPCFKDDLYVYLSILKAIKTNYNSTIICCGTYFSVDPVKKLKQYGFIDYILDSHFGDSVIQLIRECRSKRNQTIAKPVTRIVRDRHGSSDLNNEPVPNNFFLFKDPRAISIEYATGCPFSCFFCDYKYFMPQFQLKDIETMINEIKFNYKRGVRYFWIHASAINLREDRLRKFCKALLKGRLNCKWSAPLIPSKLKKSTFELMNKAGCRHLRIGIETANRDIMNKFNKGLTMESIEQVLRYSSCAGIKNTLAFMVGLPSEDKNENLRKKRFIEKYIRYIDSVIIFPFQLRRGTPALKQAQELGIKLRDNMHNDNRYLEFDEINGRQWEEICEKQRFLIHDLDTFLEENKIPHLLPEEYFMKLSKLYPK